MLLAILLLSAAFFAFRFLGTQRAGGILRRAFWCGYVLWAPLVVYGLAFTASPAHWGYVIGLLAGPLLIYPVVVFIATGHLPVTLLDMLRLGLIGLGVAFLAFFVVLRVVAFPPFGLCFQWIMYRHSACGKLGGVSFIRWLAAPFLGFMARVKRGRLVGVQQ